ncbi:DUF1287 domain-containing protein [Clostridium intestinale]|uniref:DUF1287 domain-containing protein n=1 Tax=Clostridium intestinale TaxID=36845 RepID=UPI0028E6175F|nr:DUF1287 domain-containing protein [Clostridium intestinale]
MRKRKVLIFCVLLIIISVATIAFLKQKYRSALEGNSIGDIIENLPIKKVVVPDESSKEDKNNNGIPDPIDIVNEARKEVERETVYKDAYYTGGYPPEGEGVCTDVIWRGFNAINVSIKELLDKDIRENLKEYRRVNSKPDPNIDFRRVLNQDIFFKRYCESLTIELNVDDVNNLKEWQPGDIVVFVEGYEHIAIVSDKRDSDGIPYVIHNSTPKASEAKLSWFNNPIYAHYRWKY